MNVSTTDKAVKSSAWILYTLIVLEILFMVSPFAAYYYSIYAVPLNTLQQFEATAWLTMYVLPHFTYSDSWLVNGLILISWPLILLGMVVFIVGFFQIYWAKFAGKGAVEAGLYRHIRHPQYVALAIIGLGCALYWSRFVVVVGFVSMLCLYYFLARIEERICLEKFGDSYREYLDRTGRFLPRRWERRWQDLDWRMPESRAARVALGLAAYLVVVGITVGVAHALRGHVIDSLQVDTAESRVTVYLAPVAADARAEVQRLLSGARLAGDIAYVAPASWSIPELGLRPTSDDSTRSGTAELLHPTSHGNALSADQRRLSVVVVEAAHADTDIQGEEVLSRALNLRSLELLELDLDEPGIIERRIADDSEWAGVPVPTY